MVITYNEAKQNTPLSKYTETPPNSLANTKKTETNINLHKTHYLFLKPIINKQEQLKYQLNKNNKEEQYLLNKILNLQKKLKKCQYKKKILQQQINRETQ